MVIDSSALVAIALHEPPMQHLLDVIQDAKKRTISAVTVLETGMVLRSRLGAAAIHGLTEQIFKLKAEVVPFDQAQANVALTAFARFGKGMGHRAQLNFGDCAVYALAQSRGEPVLAIGRDFASTDIALVTF